MNPGKRRGSSSKIPTEGFGRQALTENRLIETHGTLTYRLKLVASQIAGQTEGNNLLRPITSVAFEHYLHRSTNEDSSAKDVDSGL